MGVWVLSSAYLSDFYILLPGALRNASEFNTTPLLLENNYFLVTSSENQFNKLVLLFLSQKPRKIVPQVGEDSQNGHLPPGWQSYMSPQGRRYYVNTFTNGKLLLHGSFTYLEMYTFPISLVCLMHNSLITITQ